MYASNFYLVLKHYGKRNRKLSAIIVLCFAPVGDCTNASFHKLRVACDDSCGIPEMNVGCLDFLYFKYIHAYLRSNFHIFNYRSAQCVPIKTKPIK